MKCFGCYGSSCCELEIPETFVMLMLVCLCNGEKGWFKDAVFRMRAVMLLASSIGGWTVGCDINCIMILIAIVKCNVNWWYRLLNVIYTGNLWSCCLPGWCEKSFTGATNDDSKQSLSFELRCFRSRSNTFYGTESKQTVSKVCCGWSSHNFRNDIPRF